MGDSEGKKTDESPTTEVGASEGLTTKAETDESFTTEAVKSESVKAEDASTKKAEATQTETREARYVGDDEEYSYRGYAEEGGENYAGFRDSDEELSYTGYAEGQMAVEEEEGAGNYTDYIVEEFSAEHNVPRVAKLTRIPAGVVTYIFAAVYIIVGALCVVFTEYVTEYLSLIVGSMMIIVGLARFIAAIVRGEYRTVKTNQTATSFIIAALGVMILIQYFDPEDDPIMLVSIAWGILGLFEAAHAFNHALKRIVNKERWFYYMVRGIVELVVAFILLYRPSSEEAHTLHIIVFGLNLILDGITMIPRIKNFLRMK